MALVWYINWMRSMCSAHHFWLASLKVGAACTADLHRSTALMILYVLQMVPASPHGGGYWSPLQPHVHASTRYQHWSGPRLHPNMPPQVFPTFVNGLALRAVNRCHSDLLPTQQRSACKENGGSQN